MKNKKLWYVIGSAFIIIAIIIVTVQIHKRPTNQARIFKIGVITPLTDKYATYGIATKRGVDLALEEINDNGGIRGVKVEVVYEDSKGIPKEARNVLEKLVNIHHVPAILGAFRSAETMAIAPEAERRKVILFSASSTADSIKYAGDFVFRNVPPNWVQGKTSAHFIIEFLNKSRAAVLYQNDDYGKSLADGFIEEFQSFQKKIVAIETFEGGQIDFRQALVKIKAKNPEVVFFPGNYQENARILKQAREMKWDVVFVGGDGAYSPDLITIAGNASNGSYYTLMAMGYGVSDEEINRFIQTFMKKYGEEPDVYAAYAYDALQIIAQAISVGGYSAEGIKNALYSLEFKGVTGITKFDEYGEVNKSYYIYEVKEGQFQLFKWLPSESSVAER